MKISTKIKSAVKDPALLRAYATWLGSKFLSRNGARMSLTGTCGPTLGEWISFSEYWGFRHVISEGEVRLLERTLKSSSDGKRVAIDVGANIGAFTLLMREMASEVHAFEPVPETFCRLKKNLDFNNGSGEAHLNCVAVGASQGLVQFEIDDRAPATNRIKSTTDGPKSHVGYVQNFASISLDQYARERGLGRVALLKIDVEGMEPYVLRGARDLFRKRAVERVLIEICPINLSSAGFTCEDLYDEFVSMDYSPYTLLSTGEPGAKLSLRDIESIGVENVLLIPN